jgi:hypothetical protein
MGKLCVDFLRQLDAHFKQTRTVFTFESGQGATTM